MSLLSSLTLSFFSLLWSFFWLSLSLLRFFALTYLHLSVGSLTPKLPSIRTHLTTNSFREDSNDSIIGVTISNVDAQRARKQRQAETRRCKNQKIRETLSLQKGCKVNLHNFSSRVEDTWERNVSLDEQTFRKRSSSSKKKALNTDALWKRRRFRKRRDSALFMIERFSFGKKAERDRIFHRKQQKTTKTNQRSKKTKKTRFRKTTSSCSTRNIQIQTDSLQNNVKRSF